MLQTFILKLSKEIHRRHIRARRHDRFRLEVQKKVTWEQEWKRDKKTKFPKDYAEHFGSVFLHNIFFLYNLMHMSIKPCASIRIQTIIHEYEKFIMYIARVHTTKIAPSTINI